MGSAMGKSSRVVRDLASPFQRIEAQGLPFHPVHDLNGKSTYLDQLLFPCL